jgi:hypothetical protein
MATAVRWLSLLVWFAVSSTLIGQFAAHWAKQTGLFEQPADFVAVAANISLTIATHPWFYWVLAGLTSFTAGIWIQWLAMKFDQSRGRKSLGRKLVSLARGIDSAQGNSQSKWPRNIQYVRADLGSALSSVSRLGIWVPDPTIFQRRDANLLVSYLTVVGTALSDGRLTEARDDSFRCRDLLRAERAKLRARTSVRGARPPQEYIQAASARPR